MSRVAKKPIEVPAGITVTLGADVVTLKGAKGQLAVKLDGGVKVSHRAS